MFPDPNNGTNYQDGTHLIVSAVITLAADGITHYYCAYLIISNIIFVYTDLLYIQPVRLSNLDRTLGLDR